MPASDVLAEKPQNEAALIKAAKARSALNPTDEVVGSSGRELFKDADGTDYSEKTVTFQHEGKWVNIPSVDKDGNILPQAILEDFVKQNGIVDPVTGAPLPSFNTVEEAVSSAETRSDNLGVEIDEDRAAPAGVDWKALNEEIEARAEAPMDPTKSIAGAEAEAATVAATAAVEANEGLKEEVAARSAVPEEEDQSGLINYYDTDNNFLESSKPSDGDNTAKAHRLAWNPNDIEGRGIKLDVYEVDHGYKLNNTTEQKKKLLGQRKRLAFAINKSRAKGDKLDWKDLTNDNVFGVGRAAQAALLAFLQSPDGTNRVTVAGEAFDSALKAKGDNRILGMSYINWEGMDARTFMNQPMFNSSFFDKANLRGRAIYDSPDRHVKTGENISDFDATAGTPGKQWMGAAALTAEATANLGRNIVDTGVHAVTKGIAELQYGEADYTELDQTMHGNIKGIEAQALRIAQAEKTKAQNDRKGAIDVLVGAHQNALNSDTANIDIAATMEASGIDTPVKQPLTVEERAEQITLENLSPEQLAFRRGEGTASATITTQGQAYVGIDEKTGAKVWKRDAVSSTKETINDKYQTLEAERKLRGGVNKFISEAIEVGSPIAGYKKLKASIDGKKHVKEEVKVNPRDGGYVNTNRANAAAIEVGFNDKEVQQGYTDASKRYKEGDYVGAAIAVLKSTVTYVEKYPQAAVFGALRSAPEMAAMIVIPGLTIAAKTHQGYEEAKNHFFEERGSFPDPEQQKVILGVSIAKAVLEKIGAEGLAGNLGSKAGVILTKILTEKLGFTASQAAKMVVGSAFEGGEEVLVTGLDQYGKNQGLDKIFDTKEMYQSWIEGVAAGFATKGVLDLTKVPTILKGDVAKAWRGMKWVGGKLVSTKPTTKEEVTAESAKAAEDSGQSVESLLAPNAEITPDHDFATQGTDAAVPLEEDAQPSNDDGQIALIKRTAAERQDGIERMEALIAQIQIDKKGAEGKKLEELVAREKRIEPILQAERNLLNESMVINVAASVDKGGPPVEQGVPAVDEEGNPALAPSETLIEDREALKVELEAMKADPKGYAADEERNKKLVALQTRVQVGIDHAKVPERKHPDPTKAGAEPKLTQEQTVAKATEDGEAISVMVGTIESFDEVTTEQVDSIVASTTQLKEAHTAEMAEYNKDPEAFSAERIEKMNALTTQYQNGLEAIDQLAPAIERLRVEAGGVTDAVAAMTTEEAVVATAADIQTVIAAMKEAPEDSSLISNLINAQMSAERAYNAEHQAWVADPDSFSAARKKKLDGLIITRTQVKARLAKAQAAQSDTAIENPLSVDGVAETLIQGSAPAATVDTTGLEADVVGLSQTLSELDADLDALDNEKPTELSRVHSEVLGGRVNSQGKAGIARHLSNLGAAIAGNSRANAAQALQNIIDLGKSQVLKRAAILKGIKEFDAQTDTKTDVEVTYGNDQKFIIKADNAGAATVLTNFIEREIKIIAKAEAFARDLGQAKFDPEAFTARKAEEAQVARDEARKINGAARSRPATLQTNTAPSTPVVEATHDNNGKLLTPRELRLRQILKMEKSMKALKSKLSDAWYDVIDTLPKGEWETDPAAVEAGKADDAARKVSKQLVAADKLNTVTISAVQALQAEIEVLSQNPKANAKEIRQKKALIKKKEQHSAKALAATQIAVDKVINDNTAPNSTVVEGAANDTSVASEVEGASETTPATNNIPTREALIAEGKTARAKVVQLDKEIAALSRDPNAIGLEEKQDLRERTAQRIRELRSILSRKEYAKPGAETSAPTTAPIVETKPVVDPAITPTIDNSPVVPEKPQVDEMSDIEREARDADLDAMAAYAAAVEAQIDAEIAGSTQEKTVSPEVKPTKPGVLFLELRGFQEKSGVVLHSPSKDTEGPGKETLSTKLLKNLGVMLVQALPDNKVTGFIGKTADLFGTLRGVSDARFDTEARAAVRRVEEFATEFRAAIDLMLPKVTKDGDMMQPGKKEGELTVIFRQVLNRAPVLNFVDAQGKLNERVANTMAIAMLEWFQIDGASTKHQSVEDVYRFFGLDAASGALGDNVTGYMADKGVARRTQELKVGRAIMAMLNVKQKEDAQTDSRWEDRMAQSMGQLAFSSMAAMTTSHPVTGKQENRGYITFDAIPADLLTEKSGKKVDGHVIEEDSKGQALVNFVRMPTYTSTNGNPLVRQGDNQLVTTHSATQLSGLTSSTGFKTVMKAVQGENRRNSGMSAVPSTRIPEYYAKTSSRLGKELQRFVAKLNSQKLRRNKQWDLMQKMREGDRIEALKILGWRQPTVDPDTGEATFPELHAEEAKSAHGKNQGIERGYDAMLDHDNEYTAGRADVESEIAYRTAEQSDIELDSRKISGENAPRLKKLKSILANLSAQLEGYKNGDTYLQHKVISNGRTNEDTGSISTQRDKGHRNGLSLVSAIETIDLKEERHVKAAVYSLIEPLGLNKAEVRKRPLEVLATIMDEKGNFVDPVMAKGIAAIKASQTKDGTFVAADITAAVEIGGEGPHTLGGMMLLAAWSTALQTEGETSFVSEGYTEIDGTTNGVIASMRQAVGGFIEREILTKDKLSPTGRIRQLLNAGGIFFKGQKYTQTAAFLEKNADAYQSLGEFASTMLAVASQRLGRKKLGTPDISLYEARKTARENLSAANALDNKLRAAGTTDVNARNKLEVMQQAKDEADVDYGVDVFETTMPNFAVGDGEHGRVSNAIRKLMKSVVMPGGYQAGDRALSNSLFNAWLQEMYSESAAKVSGSATGPYDFAAINTTLERAGIGYRVTADNAKQRFAPEDTKRLKGIYASSLGKTITDAYRETMGGFTHNMQTLNAVFAAQGILGAAILEQHFAVLQAKQPKGAMLSKAQKDAERKRVHAEYGDFVGFKSFRAEGFADSHSIVKEERKVVNEDESAEFGGHVYLPLADKSLETTVHTEVDGKPVTDVRKTKSMTSRLEEWVPSAEMGVAGAVGMVIHMDGMVQALSAYMDGDNDALNIYDANITGILRAAARGKVTNQAFEIVMQEFSVWDGAVDQMQKLQERYHAVVPKDSDIDIAAKGKFNTYLSREVELADGTTTGNRHAPTYIRADGKADTFTSITEFFTYAQAQRVEGNLQRGAVTRLVKSSDNHAGEGTAHILDNATDTDVQGSSSERIDIRDFEAALKTSATVDRVSSLFAQYAGRSNTKDSRAHIERLTTMMNNHILPMVRRSSNYTVSVDSDPSKPSGGAVYKGVDVYIRESDTTERLFGSDMSDAEVLTHEFLHPVIKAGLKGSARAIAQLRVIMKAAENSPDFNVGIFLEGNDSPSAEDKRRAEALYNHVMSNEQEFMTFGLSNERVQAALKLVTVPPKIVKKGILGHMVEMLSGFFDDLTGQLAGRTTSTDAATSLDDVINSFDATTRIHSARRIAGLASTIVESAAVTGAANLIERGSGAISNAITEKISEPLDRWQANLPYSADTRNAGGVPRKRDQLAQIAATPIRLTKEGFQAETARLVREKLANKHDAISSAVREVIGEGDIVVPLHEMLGRVNQEVESDSLIRSEIVGERVSSAFKKPLTPSEQRMLADTALRTDLKALLGSFANLPTLLRDSDARRAAMTAAVNSLTPGTDLDWVIGQAQNLGSVLAGQNPTIPNGNLNAHNIASGFLSANTSRKDLRNTDAIDQLKTLYALDNLTEQERVALAKMIETEGPGVKEMLVVDSVNHEGTLEHVLKGDKSAVEAGQVISKSNNRTSVIIAPTRDQVKLKAQGWVKGIGQGSGQSLYSKPSTGGEYQKGMISLGDSSLEGAMVKEGDRVDGDYLRPVMKKGRLVGYRKVMDRATREREASENIGATESLGNHAGRVIRLAKGDFHNAKILDYILEDFTENSADTDAWIAITTSSKDRQVREFAQVMSREMRAEVRRTWPDGKLYMRREQLNLLIGFRKLSLVDVANSASQKYFDREMPVLISASLKLTGDIWQGIVGEAKRRTVIFTPEVVIGNGISNAMLSKVSGMSVGEIVRGQKEGLAAIRAYTQFQKEKARLVLAIEMKDNVAANTHALKRVVQLMEASGAHNMVEAGMYQTIVEDIDISANGAASPLGAVLQSVLPQSFNDQVETQWQKTPDVVKQGLGVVMLTPDTKLGKMVQEATAQSDFVARYALIQHMMKEGSTEAEAMQAAREIFVDYSPNSSRELQYINDSGLYMYTKFLFRIQRVIMRAFRENPQGLLAMEAAQFVLGDAPDAVNSSFVFGVSIFGSGRSLTPVDAADTLLELPLWTVIKGLLGMD